MTFLAEIMDDFYQELSRDLLVGFFFKGKNLKQISQNQAQLVGFVLKLLPGYSGKSPGVAHLELAPILKGHFERRLRILEDTLKKHGLSDTAIQDWVQFESSFRKGVQAENT